MPITTLSSREFNQNRAKATRAARKGPVFITNRGKPSLVLLSAEQYQKLSGKRQSMADLLYHPGAAEIDFEPGRMSNDIGLRIPDFT
jgi:prevent-host-death family protein